MSSEQANVTCIQPEQRTPWVLVDGMYFVFRLSHQGYRARKQMTAQGQPIGAIRGIIQLVQQLVTAYPDGLILFTFDSKQPSFRKQRYAEYKAKRAAMPEDLVSQIKPIQDILHAQGIPVISQAGFEADDLIATLTVRAQSLHKPVFIYSQDKDLAQLITTDTVHWVRDHNEQPEGRQAVYQRFSVYPEQMVDYLALLGDQSDNIPGVQGCGKKTAAAWLNQYGSIEQIIAHADEISGAVGKHLRQSFEQLVLSQSLIKLCTDVDISESSLKMKSADVQRIQQLYSEFDCLDLLPSDITGEAQSEVLPQTDRSYQCAESLADYTAWETDLDKHDPIAIVLQTVSAHHQNGMGAQIIGCALSQSKNQAIYLPEHVLAAPDCQKALHRLASQHTLLSEDAKQCLHALNTIELAHARILDVLLEGYLIDSLRQQHLEHWVQYHLSKAFPVFAQAQEEVSDQLCERADAVAQLHSIFQAQLKSTEAFNTLFETIEQPLIAVLYRMEQTGILVKTAVLEQQSADLYKRLQSLEHEAYDLAGATFNLQSPKQLQAILFDQLQLPKGKITKTGQASTSEAVLQQLASIHPLPALILEHRHLSKLRSYTEKLPQLVSESTGRLHTHFRQKATITGRLSSSDPNLQNIPIRTAEGRAIREAFVAREGCLLICADYSQIELRVMAHIAQDARLIDAFQNDLDIHSATASEVFNIPEDQVSEEHRRRAKAINFGLIYGMSAYGLSRQLSISRAEAQQYLDCYFKRYPGVQAYMEHIRVQALEFGYVETLLGRRLYLPEINSRNQKQRQAAERLALNAPIQGTSADIIKLAMIAADHQLPEASLILQVHDELIFEVEQHQVEKLVPVIRDCMTSVTELSVPLVVQIGQGAHWSEAH